MNRYLVAELKARGLRTDSMRSRLKLSEGSIQEVEEVPTDLKEVYRTVWVISMRSLIDMAADRGAYIDQSQSLNLSIENPNIAQLSSMCFYTWKKGLKTTYYLRSRPATRIAKATIGADAESSASVSIVQPLSVEAEAEAAQVCSLEDQENCEAYQ